MKKLALIQIIKEEIHKIFRGEFDNPINESTVDYGEVINKIFNLYEKYGGDKNDVNEIEVQKVIYLKRKAYEILYRGRMLMYLEKFEKEVEDYLKSTNLDYVFTVDNGQIHIYYD